MWLRCRWSSLLEPTCCKPPQFQKRKCRIEGLSDQGCGAPRQPPGLFVNKSFETFIFLASFIGSNLPQACPIPVLASLLCHSTHGPSLLELDKVRSIWLLLYSIQSRPSLLSSAAKMVQTRRQSRRTPGEVS